MLSLFPELFNWSAVAVSVLRAITALFFLYASWNIKRGLSSPFQASAPETYSFAFGTTGSFFLLLGLYTQAAAIGLCAVALGNIFLSRKKTPGESFNIAHHALLAILALSFLFLGPGPYAFDLPI